MSGPFAKRSGNLQSEFRKKNVIEFWAFLISINLYSPHSNSSKWIYLPFFMYFRRNSNIQKQYYFFTNVVPYFPFIFGNLHKSEGDRNGKLLNERTNVWFFFVRSQHWSLFSKIIYAEILKMSAQIRTFFCLYLQETREGYNK